MPVTRSSALVALAFTGVGVDQRILVELNRRNFRGKDAPVAEELPQVDRHVGSRQELLERLDRNLVDGFVGDLADLAIRILEQVHENRQLFVGARGKRALRRLQADVAIDFASLEQIEKRCRAHQGVCRYSL